MILYSAIKYNILDWCIDTIFNSIYKNFKPNLLMSGNSTVQIVEGMYFDTVILTSSMGVQKLYNGRVTYAGWSKIRIRADYASVLNHNNEIVEVTQPTNYNVSLLIRGLVEFYINGQRLYLNTPV